MTVGEDELLAAVNAAFEVTSRGLAHWPDPHHGVMPTTNPEEYSRWTDPEKWRIAGARADAWIEALVATGLGNVETDAAFSWQGPPSALPRHIDRVTPTAVGAIPLTVARIGIGIEVDGGGERLVLGAGDPAVFVVDIPDCGCDACDSGSQGPLDELDEYVRCVVSGAFRRLTLGERQITVVDGDGVSWSASGGFDRGEIHAIIEDASGWDEIRGESWFGGEPEPPSR